MLIIEKCKALAVKKSIFHITRSGYAKFSGGKPAGLPTENLAKRRISRSSAKSLRLPKAGERLRRTEGNPSAFSKIRAPNVSEGGDILLNVCVYEKFRRLPYYFIIEEAKFG